MTNCHNHQETITNLEALKDRWPSAFVARREVGKFSGGILHPKTLANLDSKGEGPAGRIRVGRTVAYTVNSLIAWLQDRAEVPVKKERRGE